MRKYKNYTDEDIIRVSAEVTSLRQLLIALGLKPVGGNYANMRKNLQRLGIKAEHWTGQGWSKDRRLRDWSDYRSAAQKRKALIRARGNVCEMCGLSTWLSCPIVLEVHHIDGDRTHNEPENLQLLCPNCHSTTDTWRNRKAKEVDM